MDSENRFINYLKHNYVVCLDFRYMFIGTSSWGNSNSVIKDMAVANDSVTFQLDTDDYPNSDDVRQFYRDFRAMKPGSGAGQNNYNPFFRAFWEAKFSCSFEGGTCDISNKNLDDVPEDPYVPFTLMAVEAIIRGTKAASMRYCGGIHVCSELLNRDESRGLKIWNCKCDIWDIFLHTLKFQIFAEIQQQTV